MQQTLINDLFIFATRFRRPLMFQTMNSVRSKSLSFKNQKLKPSGYKDIGIRIFMFVAITQLISGLYTWSLNLSYPCNEIWPRNIYPRDILNIEKRKTKCWIDNLTWDPLVGRLVWAVEHPAESCQEYAGTPGSLSLCWT